MSNFENDDSLEMKQQFKKKLSTSTEIKFFRKCKLLAKSTFVIAFNQSNFKSQLCSSNDSVHVNLVFGFSFAVYHTQTDFWVVPHFRYITYSQFASLGILYTAQLIIR